MELTREAIHGRRAAYEAQLEVLRSQLEHLQQQHQSMVARINATMGAIAECDYWLGEFDGTGEVIVTSNDGLVGGL